MPELQVPPQESTEHWITSFYLKREVELQQLYDLASRDLDILMAECQTIVDDTETRRGKFLLASTFLNLARLIRADRNTTST